MYFTFLIRKDFILKDVGNAQFLLDTDQKSFSLKNCRNLFYLISHLFYLIP